MKNRYEKSLWSSPILEKITGGKSSGIWECKSVQIDSRKIKKGDLFIPLLGDRFDGHDFIKSAFYSGAEASMLKKGYIKEKLDFKNIVVDDVYNSFYSIAKESRKRAEKLYNTKFIAITGSSGKTSTKEMMKAAFNRIGNSYASPESFNNQVGVPYSLINIPRYTDFGIFEVGMNHFGEIKNLSSLIKPNIAIITNISEAHIGNFNNLDEIIEAKSEILIGLVKEGCAIINREERYFERIKLIFKNLGINNLYSFGNNQNADVCLKSRKITKGGQIIEADVFGKSYKYKINMDGNHQAINSLSVLASLEFFNCDTEKAIGALNKIKILSGRGRKHNIYIKNQESVLIDDSYNANPSSVEASLKLLTELSKGNRRVLVIGDMKELGKFSEYLHEKIASSIKKLNIELVVCVGEESKIIYRFLKNNIESVWYKDIEDLIKENFTKLLLPGDYILVKGSRKMEMNKLVNYSIKNLTNKEFI